MNFQITRIRLASVGPEPARYDPLQLDLRKTDQTGPADSVLFLPNTGGKTVLMRLLFSVLHPPIVERIGTEESTSLSQGAGRLDEQSQGLTERLRSLLDVLDQDGQALQGGALKAYREGQAELVAGFNALLNWCQKYGVNLNLGQERINATDADSEQDFAKAQQELTYMKPIN